jgi:hypothetical protein
MATFFDFMKNGEKDKRVPSGYLPLYLSRISRVNRNWPNRRKHRS